MPLEIPFILETPNTLSPDFCSSVIDKFEKDPRKYQGAVGSESQRREDVKKSTDLLLSPLEEWKEEDTVFNQSLNENLHPYLEKVLIPCNWNAWGCEDTGYQIQRTLPGEFYTWHPDQPMLLQEGRFNRLVTFIWYLNTLEPEDEGYTEFWDGTRIQPEVGKLLLFPATWTYIHRGYPPRKTKYICTGWLRSNVLTNELPPLI
jgi:hypothetical protein